MTTKSGPLFQEPVCARNVTCRRVSLKKFDTLVQPSTEDKWTTMQCSSQGGVTNDTCTLQMRANSNSLTATAINSVSAESLSCVQLFFNPIDCNPPGFSLHAISQARILERVAISFSRGSSQPRNRTHMSCTSKGIFTAEPRGKSLMISACVHAKLLQLCPPGSSVLGVLQARILEWVAMSSSRGIFPTQGSSPGLLHCRQIPYCLSHQGSSNWSMTQFGVMIWMGILHLLL